METKANVDVGDNNNNNNKTTPTTAMLLLVETKGESIVAKI